MFNPLDIIETVSLYKTTPVMYVETVCLNRGSLSNKD